MPLHDIHYKHWTGTHLGIWARRWVIARNGLAACLQNKMMRNFIVMCWVLGLSMSALMFLIGQLLVPDSIVVQWTGKFNQQLQLFVKMLMTWMTDHPEISVATTQNVLFYFFTTYTMPFSIFVLGLAMPSLVTRDLASNAILIYSSKAVTRGDYLLGKFCTAFGILTMTWLGPVCAGVVFGEFVGAGLAVFLARAGGAGAHFSLCHHKHVDFERTGAGYFVHFKPGKGDAGGVVYVVDHRRGDSADCVAHPAVAAASEF